MEDQHIDDEPQLSRGIKILLGIGSAFLLIFGVIYFANHAGDPDYFKTVINPDSTLADKDIIVFDTIAIDTLSKDSIDKEQDKQAKEVFNSIRHRKPKVELEETTEDNAETEHAPEPVAPPQSVATPTAPKIEKIEVK